MKSSKTKTWQHSQKTDHLATLPEIKLSQPIWRIGSTQWDGGHLHHILAIDGAPPHIGFPPHQILFYHHPKIQNSGLETQNRPKATSNQNWRQMTPLPRWFSHTLYYSPPTTISLTNSHKLVTTHHLSTWSQGGVHVFVVSQRIPNELGWNFTLHY